MSSDFKEKQSEIVQSLNAKLPGGLKCPVCEAKQFSLVDGYFAHDIQPNLENRRMGGINVPTVPVVCSNCGYIMEFAAARLIDLPKKDDSGDNK
jgi:transcription elongation factor Elf1